MDDVDEREKCFKSISALEKRLAFLQSRINYATDPWIQEQIRKTRHLRELEIQRLRD